MLLGGLIVNSAITTSPSIYDDLNIQSKSDKYHIHADFVVQIENETIELGVAELTTTAEQHLHSDAHLHDENGDVLHIHEEGVSLVESLNSINIHLTDSCITTNGKEHCPTENERLSLYVNGNEWTDYFSKYVPSDLDQVLLYFGDQDSLVVTTYLESIPDDSCIYSGSCPERGIAPSEECGLTCDL